jgi:cyclophilin family peptidyl-prolyl cis-trans isomerase/HEAT repeat protein
MRPGLPLVFALLALPGAPARQGESSVWLEEILQIEDRRALGEGDVVRLQAALAHRDSLVVRRAARALGRLERPELASLLFPLLRSRFPGVRSTALEGIAQAAQGLRGDSSSGRAATWTPLLAALLEQLREENDPAVRGMLALSLGRLPYHDPGEIASVRRALIDLCSGVRAGSETNTRFCRGAESLVRMTWRRVPLEDGEREGLRAVVLLARAAAPRRHALGALVLSQSGDDSTLGMAIRDPDAELRRLALTGVRRLEGKWESHPVLTRGLEDPDPAVRLEALRALSRAAGTGGCGRLLSAARDSVLRVRLMAIDLLGGCGTDSAAVEWLAAMVRLQPSGQSLQPSALSRQSPAVLPAYRPSVHALVSLSRAAPTRALPLIPHAAASPHWQARMYAARAAAAARDSATLMLLAEDPSPNVREAAITGLGPIVGHAADPVYRHAVVASDYQLVLAAASALAGTPDPSAASTALLVALDRISGERALTSRDPRLAILARLRETGSPMLAARLMPYLEDFDPAVADSAAALLSSWTGQRWQPRPRPLPVDPVTLQEVLALRGKRMVFSMAGGGQFEVELLVDEAPVTVARIARLVRQRYYDGLSFHRVAPNFVIQGGSPGANEYSGIPGFMRDELGAVSHARGTLGVSTRGRDTGDGQLFVNLRDNPRLDYDYTVWGRVARGQAVVDAVQEGDGIHRVEIRSR